MDKGLVYYLKRYTEKHNTDILTISFTEIAQELNSSREVISRLMKKLSEKGAIDLQSNRVRILDLNTALR